MVNSMMINGYNLGFDIKNIVFILVVVEKVLKEVQFKCLESDIIVKFIGIGQFKSVIFDLQIIFKELNKFELFQKCLVSISDEKFVIVIVIKDVLLGIYKFEVIQLVSVSKVVIVLFVDGYKIIFGGILIIKQGVDDVGVMVNVVVGVIFVEVCDLFNVQLKDKGIIVNIVNNFGDGIL